MMVIETLGGYRLVRKLGESTRAEVFLAHPLRATGDAAPAAMKIFRGGVDAASIVTEITALSRSAGAHTVQLLDLTTAPDASPALILSRCSGGSVGRLIRARSELRAGEAITILAPVATTLKRLHDDGVVHGALRPEAVLFDQAGTPIIGCFGSARLVAPGLSRVDRDAEPAFRADLAHMRRLAALVLERVRDGVAIDAREWVRVGSPTDDEWLEKLVETLFRLGDPCPVDLSSDPADFPGTVPSRLAQTMPPMDAPEVQAHKRFAVPDVIARLLPEQLIRAADTARLRAAITRVRPRFWIVLGAVVAAVLMAWMLVPNAQSEAMGPEPSIGSAPPQSAVAPTGGAAKPDDGAITADDPVAAAVRLLAQRESCLASASLLCLDNVVQQNSAAADADRAAIRAIQSGGELPTPWRVTTAQVAIEERLGDSAIVRLDDVPRGEPTSLLLMKTEAGWRIRDYIAS